MSTGPYTKLVIAGNVDGIQDWSVGVSVQCEADATAAQLNTWLAAVSSALSTYWASANSPSSFNKTTFNITALKAFAYNEIGSPSVSSAELILGTVLHGTGTGSQPTQCSIVHTHLTGFTGRHNTGRVYWPATATITFTANSMSSAITLALATGWAAFLHALSALIINGTTTTAAIVPSSGASESHFITTVAVGSIVDTQRRRRDKYVEVRSSHSV